MTITTIQRTPKQYMKVYKIDVIDRKDPLKQLNGTLKDIKDTLIDELKKKNGLKINITLKVMFEKIVKKTIDVGDEFVVDDEGNIIEDEFEYVYKSAYFTTKAKTILNEEDIETVLHEANEEIINKVGNWISEGSGWTIDEVIHHYLNIIKYMPLHGSSYIELPEGLRNRKALVNIKNNDTLCFMWCHLAYLFPADQNPNRVSKYKPYTGNVFYEGIKFPVTLDQIPKIEDRNDIRFNIFGYENETIYPLYISKKNYEPLCEMLLINEGEKSHYVWIKDFNKLMFRQTKYEGRKHFCRYCLQCFSKDDVLQKHIPNCLVINEEQGIKMPEKGESIKFKNCSNQLSVPFVIYCDIEALLVKTDSIKSYDSSESFTEEYQNHVDCGYAYKVVCCYDDKYSKPVETYRGPDAVYWLIKNILEEEKYCKKIKKEHFNKDMIMTRKDIESFQNSDRCHICNKTYEEGERKVRDHCHVTGKYRGSAHESCNLNFKLTNRIPVIFHNLRGYDSHFIMQQIGKFTDKINVIPNNMEKYMAFMIGKNLVFLDSFQFMSQTLDALVKNLPEFKYMNHDLLKRKGVYPYDYMDSFERFNETELPTKDKFYSLLNNEHISDSDYEHAKNVWNTFNIKNLGEYHNLYLETDVLLLTDVFENFRKTCLEYYKLDPCHYFTSPGLAWDAMLKMTGVKLDLIHDVDQYLMIEKGLRGGISYISKRHSQANNPYLKDFNPDDETKYIMYLDSNNLYAWAMKQNMPTGSFKWVNGITKGHKNYIVECDLEYPEELHNLHDDYPLAPEKLIVKDSWLSDYSLDIKRKFDIPSSNVKKLIPNCMSKKKYVLHYRNLELYESLGMKVTKIHRILQFDESPWLKKYIDFNTEKRKLAKNAFEKDFFKLMNNSVFGKTMENLRKRINVKLVTNEDKLIKLASKPNYISSKMFNDNLFAVHSIKECLLLNRPAYVGMCILDLSKLLMYDFHYNYIKQKYNHNARLLFTDTDSLCYEIKTEDVYNDFYEDKHLFDFSDYSPDSKFYDSTNKKVIGKFKDEACGIPIREFVGLKSKLYSYVLDNEKSVKKCKGIKKNVVKNEIMHENYKDVLFNKSQSLHQMNVIRSDKHKIKSITVNKISLSCYDDKRYILSDGVNTMSFGCSDLKDVKEVIEKMLSEVP